MENGSRSGELDVGAVLGGSYRIKALLGRGGMGAVWLAEHVRLPKQVAVKVLWGAAASQPEIAARFQREAEIASRLDHPNIVDVLDYDVLPDGTPYLVLELLQGESLAARLDRGPLTLDDTLSIVRQIAAALFEAHARGIVHRDLKPDNVFLCPREIDGVMRDHVKVLDFGISKIRGSQTVKTQTSAVLGTPQYMSPEQASGQHDRVDGRTDQFALAAMICEMLSGQPMFAGASLAEVIFKVVYQPLPPLDQLLVGVPDWVRAALERALQRDPDDRFADLSDFVEALTGKALAVKEGSRLHASAGDAQRGPASFAPTMASGDHGLGRVGAAHPSQAPTRQPLSASAQTLDTGEVTNPFGTPSHPAPPIAHAGHPSGSSSGRSKLPWIVAGLALFVGGGAVAALVVRTQPPPQVGNVAVSPSRTPSSGEAPLAQGSIVGSPTQGSTTGNPGSPRDSHPSNAAPTSPSAANASPGSPSTGSTEPRDVRGTTPNPDSSSLPKVPKAGADESDDDAGGAAPLRPKRGDDTSAAHAASGGGLPAELAADAQAGRNAIAAGDWSAAIMYAGRLTRSTEGKGVGYGILFLAYCGQRSLSDVVKLAPKLSSSPAAERKRLRAACRKLFPNYAGSP